MTIRFADKADCAAITEIYNHAVLHTAAIWNDRTVDTDNRLAWYEARQLLGYPVLVSEENGVVTGYASFGDWRSFDGFRYTVEHSVYVHPAHQGKGLGRKLLSRLIDEARRCGKHVMVAGIGVTECRLDTPASFAGIYRYRANAAGRRKIWPLVRSYVYAAPA
ncbi:acetyltransferase [Salmonella enterica subsp. enterica]|nr:acetyltransferase [Salmonella enterica subsp. enterica]